MAKKNYRKKNYGRKTYGKSKNPSKKYKKFSFLDRYTYYQNKANNGATRKEQDFAYGYLDGMRGIRIHPDSSEHEKSGNTAGLRFWGKMTQKKI